MLLKDALSNVDWEAIAGALGHTAGLDLVDAVTDIQSGDVEGPGPVGVWHVAAVRRNLVTSDAAPVDAETLGDPMGLRDALKDRAEAGSIVLSKASRGLTDPGFLVVRPDGAYRSITVHDDVVTLFTDGGEERAVTLDLIDRVEAIERGDGDASAWRAPVADGDGLDARWPDDRDTVLSFATASPDAQTVDVVEAELGERPTAVAVVMRRTGRLLTRTLYAGDFAGSERARRTEVVMLMHRRLWCPPG